MPLDLGFYSLEPQGALHRLKQGSTAQPRKLLWALEMARNPSTQEADAGRCL